MNISFQLDNPDGVVTAGTTMSGRLHISATKEISAKRLEFSFRSEESTKVKYTTSSSGKNHSTQTHYAYQTSPLYHLNIPVDQHTVIQNGKIRPGDYVVPFSTHLPASLPETMGIAANGGYAKIDHGLKATFKGSGFFSNYKNTMEVYVKAMPTLQPTVPFLQEPTTQKISHCCFPRGDICFGARIADTHLVRGQSVQIDMSCVNNTTVAIERVYSKLNQHVSWQAQGRSETCKHQLCSTDFGKLTEMQAKDRQSLKLKASSVADRSGGYTDQQRVLREIQNHTYSRHLQAVPVNALLTYSGRLITVTHQISLRLRTGTCITDAKIHVPVKLAAGDDPPVLSPTTTSPPPPAHNPQHIPFATAIPVVSATTMPTPPPPTVVPGFAMGSLALQQDQANTGMGHDDDDWMEPDILIEPVDVVPSLEQLLVEMENSTNDLSIVRSKLQQAMWLPVFGQLSPIDFGKVLTKIDIDFDQVSVAEAMAPHIHGFKCEYVVVALRKVADWNRSNIVEKLAPHCLDFATHKDTIRKCLTEWEKMVTQRVFEES